MTAVPTAHFLFTTKRTNMDGNATLHASKRLAVFVLLLTICFWLADSSTSLAAGVWTNEPAGANVVTDWGWPTLTGSGWHDEGGSTGVASDGTAPLSPSSVLQQTFNTGMPAGISPGNNWFAFPQPAKEVYIGFWWKANAGFENHPVLTKILFLSDTNGNPIFFYMAGAGPSVRIGMQYQNSDIDNSHISGFPGVPGTFDIGGGQSVTLGSWAKLELYVKRSTTPTSRDGIFRYWVNGVLAREFTNMNYRPYDFASVPIVPIWGGTGGSKTKTDYFSYDHIHISLPNGGTTNDQPPGPPNVPTLRSVTVP